jgi:tRNA dimethylallyltransferase
MEAGSLKSPPLIVIVGPTASGKTGLAIELADHFNGEIICADSRTIYKGMDIGTAKPTKEEQERIPHWGVNLVEPGERFTAVDFKQYALLKIDEIRRRGRIPILVGGTGLYVDAVIFNYTFGGDLNTTLRHQLEKYTLVELHNYCRENNILLPENSKNKRYVIRMIERNGVTHKIKDHIIDNCIVVGIATDKNILVKRINDRAEQLFHNNVVNEAIILGKKYGWHSEAMTGNIYRVIKNYFMGNLNLADAKEKFKTLDWQLAKRQLTWFRRNQFIHWLSLTDAHNFLFHELAIYKKS